MTDQPRFIEWDYNTGTATEYARSGECNGCGACCQTLIRGIVSLADPSRLGEMVVRLYRRIYVYVCIMWLRCSTMYTFLSEKVYTKGVYGGRMVDDKKDAKKTTNEKPVSLYPMTADEALKALLQVKPSEMESMKVTRKKGKPKQ